MSLDVLRATWLAIGVRTANNGAASRETGIPKAIGVAARRQRTQPHELRRTK